MRSIDDRKKGFAGELLPFEREPVSWATGEYKVSTDRALLDISVVEQFLIEEASWGAGLTSQMIFVGITNSLPFGLYHAGGEMIGFARVVTDGAMFAYLRDVFVVRPHRGKGLAKWLVECVSDHPDIKDVRTWLLSTRDAHGLYERCGFRRSEHPDKYMERQRLKPT